jgi:hypothetical protein
MREDKVTILGRLVAGEAGLVQRLVSGSAIRCEELAATRSRRRRIRRASITRFREERP